MTSDKVGYKPAHAIKERFKDHISGKIFLYCGLGMASIFRPNAAKCDTRIRRRQRGRRLRNTALRSVTQIGLAWE